MVPNQRPDRPIQLLVVDDSPSDARLAREALHEANVPSEVRVATDGLHALELLREPGFPRPDIILLDLDMPRMDGRTLLRELKTDPDLGRIPVVVMSSSDDDRDITRSYRLHANCYVTKPADLDAYVSALRLIESFWLEVAALPAD